MTVTLEHATKAASGQARIAHRMQQEGKPQKAREYLLKHIARVSPKDREAVLGLLWRYMAKREGKKKGVPEWRSPNQYHDGMTELERKVIANKHRHTPAVMAKMYNTSTERVLEIIQSRAADSRDEHENQITEEISQFLSMVAKHKNGAGVRDLPSPSNREGKVRQLARARGFAAFEDRGFGKRWYVEKTASSLAEGAGA